VFSAHTKPPETCSNDVLNKGYEAVFVRLYL